MFNRQLVLLKSTVLAALALLLAAPAYAQNVQPAPADSLMQFLPAALVMFLPLGMLLLISSAQPERQAPAAAISLLAVWSVAALAYFAVGFAFNFGGVAQVHPHPDFAGLYWEWYPLDQSVEAEVARLWGVIALQGWTLSGAAAREGVLLLFLSHAALVGAAAMIPAGVLLRRGRVGAALLGGLLTGGLLYPVAGNWLWGGGWLSNLGASLEMGHGLVDFGGSSVIFLLGGSLALAALAIFRPDAASENANSSTIESADPTEPNADEAALAHSPPMPQAHLPILSTLGGGVLLLGWLGLASGVHNPTAVNFFPAQAAAAGLLAGLAAALTAAGYSWFTTQEFNPWMAGRGLAAGIAITAAGAPFLPLWLCVVAGLVIGLLLPALIYLVDQKTALRDDSGALVTFGLSGLLGLLLVGLAADGQTGQGWNRIGQADAAQGVVGVLSAAGTGQLQAQLLGAGVILLWSLLLGLATFQLYRLVAERRPSPAAQTEPTTEGTAEETVEETSEEPSEESNEARL